MAIDQSKSGCVIPVAFAVCGFSIGLLISRFALEDMDIHSQVVMIAPGVRRICFASIWAIWFAFLGTFALSVSRSIRPAKTVLSVVIHSFTAFLAGLILVVPISLMLHVIAHMGIRGAAAQTYCANNLKQILLAVHNYQDAYGVYPPVYIADKNGKPIHSWRILILPFLDVSEAKKLYSAYSFAEPWDGPNNRKLAEIMPEVFGCPVDPGRRRMTSYLAVTREGTAFPMGMTIGVAELEDGADKMVAFIEARESGVLWTEPRDVTRAHGRIGGNHLEGTNRAFADGSVEFINSFRKK